MKTHFANIKKQFTLNSIVNQLNQNIESLEENSDQQVIGEFIKDAMVNNLQKHLN